MGDLLVVKGDVIHATAPYDGHFRLAVSIRAFRELPSAEMLQSALANPRRFGLCNDRAVLLQKTLDVLKRGDSNARNCSTFALDPSL